MANYRAQKEAVQGRQLKVQRLSIPFTITGHATPASKSFTVDEPAVLFLQLEGIDKITEAAGCLDSGETATPDQTVLDSTGKFNMCVKVDETVSKIVSAVVINRKDGTLEPCFVNASGDSLTSNDDKILLNCDSDVNLASANLDACLVIEYVI